MDLMKLNFQVKKKLRKKSLTKKIVQMIKKKMKLKTHGNPKIVDIDISTLLV